MTRTEDDLRTLLRRPVEADAPERVLARVLGAAPPARRTTPARPWRIGLASAGAVVLVGAVVVGVETLRPDDRALPSPASTVRPSTTTPTSDPGPTGDPAPGTGVASRPGAVPPGGTVVSFLAGSGYEVGATALFAGEETVDAVPDGATTAVATVHAGPVELTPVPSKPAVTLAPGVTATWAVTAAPGAVSPTGDALTWTVDGVPLTVTPTLDGATDAMVTAVARAVLVGAPEPVAVPVSVSAWPAAGWTVTGLVSTSTHRDGTTGPAGRDVLVDIALPGDDGTAVTIDSAGLAFGSGTSGGTPVEIGGRTWTWDAGSSTFEWAGPDRYVRVTSTDLAIGRDTLAALIAATSLAPDFGDESTWSTSSTAFPS